MSAVWFPPVTIPPKTVYDLHRFLHLFSKKIKIKNSSHSRNKILSFQFPEGNSLF